MASSFRIATLRQLVSPYPLLLLFIAIYIGYFSWYTINRHNTLNSYTADLSLIDQPMWNTVLGPGGYMELTWGRNQQSRLAEHFEPILVPLAMLFWLWDDVRILLIAQTMALAMGAVPIFRIARYLLSEGSDHISDREPVTWVALVCATVYLLFPHLQAANIADFHADPFVVAPLLFAFWYALQRRWNWMWVWAIVAMMTKETLPTLTAMLALWLVLGAIRLKFSGGSWRVRLVHGISLGLVSIGWFYVATFLIVSPLAATHFGTDGPIYLANRFNDQQAWITILFDPARWRYVAGLLAAVGFLPLLAPELLLLGLPVLLANFFSNFSGQYSGEQHYSAPLVVAFMLATLYGIRRLKRLQPEREVNGQALSTTSLLAAALWLMAWALAYHSLYGWSPLSIRTEWYAPTAASTRLPELLPLVPANTMVSASAGVHPHLAHRRVIYTFPTVEQAGYLLVDVTDIPGTHPNDAHSQVMGLLNNGWTPLMATDGLLLAENSVSDLALPHCSAGLPLPCSFYTFTQPSGAPSTPAEATFGNAQLKLLGFDVLDDPDDGVIFRFYWQPLSTLPEELKLWPIIFDDQSHILNNPAQVPMIATVWYPPDEWSVDEVVVTETLPQLLPDTFHLGLAVGNGSDSLINTNLRWLVTTAPPVMGRPGNWAQLASFTRQGPFLTQTPPVISYRRFTDIRQQFGSAILLTGYTQPDTSLPPGDVIKILLRWETTEPLSTDYTVFVHLLDSQGNLVSQSDSFPTWLTPQPTSQWPAGYPIPDHHTLYLPPDLPPGTYTPLVGLYDPQTVERLSQPDGTTTFQLGPITVENP
jgi:uncharacterized membrane protein